MNARAFALAPCSLLAALCLGAGAARAQQDEPPTSDDSEAEVVVEGIRAPRAQGDPTLASQVVKGEALQEPGVDAARVLERTPSVQTARTGSSADATTVSLRGASSAQVPVYLGGIRLNDDVTGVADLSRLPLWMLDRVEVYRGTAPVQLDSFGVGGAVVFEPALPQKNQLRVGAVAGSWDTYSAYGGATVRTPAGSEGVQAASGVSYRYDRSAADYTYRDDRGTGSSEDDVVRRRENADYQSHQLWSLHRFAIPSAQGPVRLTALLGAQGREQGVPGLSSVPATEARARSQRLLAGLSGKAPCSLGDLACRVDLRTSFRSSQLTTSDPLSELNLEAPWVSQGADHFQAAGGLVFWPDDSLKGRVDLNYESGRLRLEEPGAVRSDSHEHRFLGTLSGSLQPIDPLLFTAAGRASCVDLSAEQGPSSAGEETVSLGTCAPEGKVGLGYDVAPWLALRANGSRSVRFPTLGERFGVSGGVRGTPGLEPETAWSTDLGAVSEFVFSPTGSLWAEAWGFARFAEELIAYQQSALGYVRPFNVGSARFLGGEFALGVDVLQHLRVRTSVSLLDPRDTSEDRQTTNDLIPFRSRLTSAGQIEGYANLEGGGIQRVAATLYLDYRGGRVADPAGLVVIPSQLLTDFALSAAVLQKRLLLRARVENLFDVAHYDSLGLPLAGRSFFVGAELLTQ